MEGLSSGHTQQHGAKGILWNTELFIRHLPPQGLHMVAPLKSLNLMLKDSFGNDVNVDWAKAGSRGGQPETEKGWELYQVEKH